MRAVLDTNIAVAGLLWRGKPYELFGLTLTGKVLCFASDTLLAELERVLGYEKLARRIATLHTTIPELLAGYRSLVEIVPAATISPTVIADPDGDHVLACAIAANADFIVSGDKHLLDLKRHQGIEIVNAGEALRRITRIEPGRPSLAPMARRYPLPIRSISYAPGIGSCPLSGWRPHRIAIRAGGPHERGPRSRRRLGSPQGPAAARRRGDSAFGGRKVNGRRRQRVPGN